MKSKIIARPRGGRSGAGQVGARPAGENEGSKRQRLLRLPGYANLNYCAVVRTKWECVRAFFGAPERLPVVKELA